LDYEAFNYWLESKVWQYYKQHVNASRDQLTIFMGHVDYYKLLKMLQANIQGTTLLELIASVEVYNKFKYRGITIQQCASTKENDWAVYVKL
jgi:hypothetical protein